MENTIHIDDDHFSGRTQYAKRLLADAVRQGCARVEGVECVRGDFMFRFRNFFRPRRSNGVVIKNALNGGLVIDICLVAQYGFTVPDICYRVQESAISAAMTLTEKKIKKVNVKIFKYHVPKHRVANLKKQSAQANAKASK